MKSDFVATASHELRTPLTAILGFSELLKESEDMSETDRGQVDIIHNNAIIMAELINDMLDLHKIETNKTEINRKWFNPLDVLRKELKAYEGVSEKHQFEIIFDPPDISFYADSETFKLVIRNLLSNAVKYSPEGGRITLRLWNDEEHRRSFFSVEDEGIGMRPEAMQNVFEKFYRSRDAQERCISGTGLGLSLVKTIVHRHDGAITCESQFQKGTMFTLWMPLESADASKNSRPLEATCA